jgi:long-chain acyl-CoA synthetase
MSERLPVAEAFDRVCARRPRHAAIRASGRELQYGELLGWSSSVSAALRSSLTSPGLRVALLLPNSAEFVAAFFGAARAGGVIAPLAPQYRTQELEFYLRDLDAAALITSGALEERAAQVVAGLETPPALIRIGPAMEVRVLRPGGARRAALDMSGSPALLQQYTSGSTGMPKRVVRTHAALLAELEALHEVFALSPDDRFLGAAPFSHVNGLVRTMLASMYAGATLYPVEEFRRREVLDLLTRERITFFGGVPQMFAILGQTPARGHVDLSALRIAFSSSAPLLPADNRAFRERYGVCVRQLYGSTETGTISFNSHPEPEPRLASVGTPLKGVRVTIVGEQGNPLPDGEEGEIAISSPFAASGYVGNPTATKEAFRDGLYLSGDLGTKEADGYITLTGRKKLMINRGGFKVNPYEVEAAIKEHPKVADVAVFGTTGPHGDDIVCCHVVAAGPCTADEIVAHCQSRIADYKIPTRIEFRESLPKSSTGKILRAKLG